MNTIEWHPCNKRKSTRPDRSGDYLITLDRYSKIAGGWVKDDVMVDKYYSDGFDSISNKFEIELHCRDKYCHMPRIKAWAYLPEPYKKEENK